MASSELAMLLGNIESGLDVTYELDGTPQSLSGFTGVVRESGDGDHEYYEWGVVSLADDLGMELRSVSGRVHTHSVSYVAQQLASGDLVPAVYDRDTDTVRVATIAESSSP